MKEKTADEMFKELGYRKFDGLYEIEYISENGNIKFIKAHNLIEIYKHEDTDFIDMQELQAINKKCQEKGWLD